LYTYDRGNNNQNPDRRYTTCQSWYRQHLLKNKQWFVYNGLQYIDKPQKWHKIE
jgi:hypothetical protein